MMADDEYVGLEPSFAQMCREADKRVGRKPKDILKKVRTRNAARQAAESNADRDESLEPPWPSGPEDYGPNDGNAESAPDAAKPEAQVQPLFDPWGQYVVPEFPLDVLPPVARDFVAAQSVVVGCDPSALAMAVLAAFSGALDHRFSLKMLRNGQWWERPRLWVLLVSDPSGKKTPIINAATKPLEQHERHLRDRAEADWKQHLESGGDPKAERRKPPRFVVFDSTIEKLGDILSRTPRGLLVKRDEFSGWIGGMEKYSHSARGIGADRGFWLQAFDGGPFTVDRISRGELYIQNLSVSLIGGIQPARLAEIQGLTSDGLLQRFLPVMMRASKLAQDHPSDDEAYAGLVRELIFAKPQRLIMTDDALATMSDLRHHLHNVEQAAGGLADGFQAFVGKLAGLAGSLALILHMAADPAHSALDEIEQSTVENVRRLVVDFLLPHAFEFYRSAESGGDRLKKLASWILTSGKTRIVASDLTSNLADLRGLTLFEINERLSPFIAAGWLEPKEHTPTNRAWTVSPAVFAQFEQRIELETARKVELANLMRGPQKSST
jgi:Protein of unknown function (DUF3987)